MKRLILIFVIFISTYFWNADPCMSQWVATGPYMHNAGGMVTAGNNIFAICGNNVFCSGNNGNSWYRTVLQNEFTTPKCIAASGSNIIFIGTNTHVYRSLNAGQNWQRVGYLNKSVNTLSVLGSYVYAGTSAGVFRCQVNDTAWLAGGLINKNITAFYCTSSNLYAARLYSAGLGSVIYNYTNSDTSWNTLCVSTDTSSINSMIVNLPNILIAKTGVTVGNGIFRSTNNGMNWSRIATSYGFSLLTATNGIYAGMADGLYFSQSGGASFTKTYSLNSVGAVSLCLLGSDVYAGVSGFLTEDEGGVYKTTNNGANWSLKGFNSLTFNSFTESGGYIFAACDTLGVYKSTDNGMSWISTVMGKGWYANAVAMSGTSVIVGTMQGVYKLPNYGNGLNNISNGGFIYSVAVSGGTIFAGKKGAGIHRTTNEGTNWTLSGLANKTVRAITITPTSVLAGVDTSGGIYRSTDSGLNWTQTNNTLTVYCLTYLNNVFAGTNSGIYKSTNDGISFVLLGLNGKYTSSISVTNGNIFAGTLNEGMYYSTDGGINWTQKNEGFDGSTSVSSVHSNASVVLSGTKGRSIWRRAYSEFVGINTISTEIPDEYSLGQNYPNPFNNGSKFKFEIANSENIKINVYDIRGREVQTLVNERLQPGTYEVRFDGSMLPSGIYFYRLNAGEFSEMRKMVLIK